MTTHDLQKAPLEGVIIDGPNYENLAVGMIECTTEYDLAELPPELRQRLVDWCADFGRWTRGPAR